MSASVTRKPSAVNQGNWLVLHVVPESLLCKNEASAKVMVVLNTLLPVADLFVKFHGAISDKDTLVRADRVNDVTLVIKAPNHFPPEDTQLSVHFGSMLKWVASYDKAFTFFSNLGRARTLLSDVLDPITFMATAFRLRGTDNVALDFQLERLFRSKLPPNFDILQMDLQGYQPDQVNVMDPTLLHFAARHNLVRLCLALLCCSGAERALTTCNAEGYTPSGLAQASGNMKLASILAEAGTVRNHKVAEDVANEIYEDMSAEIYGRYREMKGIYGEYVDMGSPQQSDLNELYESVQTQQSGEKVCGSPVAAATIAIDSQSIWSSDSECSTASRESCESQGPAGFELSRLTERQRKTSRPNILLADSENYPSVFQGPKFTRGNKDPVLAFKSRPLPSPKEVSEPPPPRLPPRGQAI